MNLTYGRLLFANKKLFQLRPIRYSHTYEESLPFKKLNIISYTAVRYRNIIISKIETAVTSCGGYINDFNFFSDMGVSLQVLGIRQPDTLRELYQRLQADIQELELDDVTIKTLNNDSHSVDRYALFILFQILFRDGKGDLRRTVPAVQN